MDISAGSLTFCNSDTELYLLIKYVLIHGESNITVHDKDWIKSKLNLNSTWKEKFVCLLTFL